jgi:hypothetical protein
MPKTQAALFTLGIDVKQILQDPVQVSRVTYNYYYHLHHNSSEMIDKICERFEEIGLPFIHVNTLTGYDTLYESVFLLKIRADHILYLKKGASTSMCVEAQKMGLF